MPSVGMESSLPRMRTTLDLPAELLDEARRLLGFKSKTDTIVLSLRELVRRRRVEELKTLLGSVRLDVDIPAAIDMAWRPQLMPSSSWSMRRSNAAQGGELSEGFTPASAPAKAPGSRNEENGQ